LCCKYRKKFRKYKKNYKYNINVYRSGSKESKVIWDCKYKLLSIKPQQFNDISEAHHIKNKDNLIVSILAGVSINRLNQKFPNHKCVRVVTNIPITIGKGLTGISWGEEITEDQKQFTKKLFKNTSKIYEFTEDYLDRIIKEIIEPTINELNKRNIDYRGVIYFGLMITKSGPKVIEYNCRFGDPECQTIMPLMDQNFVFLLEKCSMGNLTGDEKINIPDKVSGCVIATSKGYPHEYKTGFQIKIGKIDSNDCQIFDSGTSLSANGKLLTNGGRVLSIVCQDKDFDMVFERAYKNLKEISFDGIYFRNDIGHQVRKNFSKEN